MTNGRKDGGIDRRQLIGLGAAGLGAIGATSLISSGAAAADDLDSSGMPRTGSGAPGGDEAEAYPDLTPGLSYYTVSLFDWFTNGPEDRDFAGGAYPATAAYLLSGVNLPPGAVVQEVVVFARNTSASSFTVNLYRYPFNNGAGAGSVASVTVPPGTQPTTTLTMTGTPHTVSGTFSYDVEAQMIGGPTQQLFGARIGYTAPPVFVPINPARVYDSRQSGYAVNGVLTPNSSRVLSVADGRDGGGTVTTPNVVPAGATAVAYNLTVAGSTGPNFLSIAAGDAATYTASAINFPGGDDRANGGVVKLDGSRQVKVFCGDQTGSTHVILDITGYYL